MGDSPSIPSLDQSICELEQVLIDAKQLLQQDEERMKRAVAAANEATEQWVKTLDRIRQAELALFRAKRLQVTGGHP